MSLEDPKQHTLETFSRVKKTVKEDLLGKMDHTTKETSLMVTLMVWVATILLI